MISAELVPNNEQNRQQQQQQQQHQQRQHPQQHLLQQKQHPNQLSQHSQQRQQNQQQLHRPQQQQQQQQLQQLHRPQQQQQEEHNPHPRHPQELKKQQTIPSNSNESDSGIEDNNETEEKQQPAPAINNEKQNGIRRRGTIWSLFSRKSTTKNLKNRGRYSTETLERQKNNDTQESKTTNSLNRQQKSNNFQDLKFINRAKSVAATSKSSISSRNTHLSLRSSVSTDGSLTSDLGDSIPSTPVSTISSSGGASCFEGGGVMGAAAICVNPIGLHNLGNTCYFNAIVQCMAHIDLISEYFITEQFMDDLETRSISFVNRLGNSRHNNNGNNHHRNHDNNNNDTGQLTYMLGLLIKSLRIGGQNYSMSLLEDVMEIIKYYNRSYNVHEQQDAQELLMWMVNQIHTECCSSSAPKRRSVKSKDIKVRITSINT